MSLNKEDLKNKIIYRSLYRGTKEMDIMISSFVKNIINILNHDELLILDDLINLDDEILKDYMNYQHKANTSEDKFIKFLRKFSTKKKNDGGETGIRTQERVAPLPVFKTGAFNRSAISPFRSFYN